MSTYEVRIGLFEGPLDLLLYLVQKQEVNPRDISIAEIADQFLAHLKEIPHEDLGNAGEFLLMAARLMALKVRELLPADQKDDVELEEFAGDREKLIRQMLEYQRFRKVAEGLRSFEDSNFGAFPRGRPERIRGNDDEIPDNAPDGVWGLYRAFRRSLVSGGARELVHTIEVDDVTIEDRQQHLQNWFRTSGRALFEDLLGRDRRRINSAVTFMALMEMVKLDEVTFRQSDFKGALWVYRKRNNSQFAEEMAAEMNYAEAPHHFKEGLAEMLRGRDRALEDRDRQGLDAVLREVLLRAGEGMPVSEDQLNRLLRGEPLENPSAAEAETPVSAEECPTSPEAADDVTPDADENTVEVSPPSADSVQTDRPEAEPEP